MTPIKVLIVVSVLIVSLIPFTYVPLDATSDSLPGYESLTDLEKKGYNTLYSAIINYDEECLLEGIGEDGFWDVSYAMMSDHPELFWFEDTYKPAVNALGDVKFTASNLNISEIENKSKRISDMLPRLIFSGNDLEKVLSIHDYLCEKIWYNENDSDAHNICGALLEEECVCDGYAKAFNYLCYNNGIKSVIYFGTVDGYDDHHSWNGVLIDGSWYYVDVTWDDLYCPGTCKYEHFLIGSEVIVENQTYKECRHPAHDFNIDQSRDSYAFDVPNGINGWNIVGASLDLKTLSDKSTEDSVYEGGVYEVGDMTILLTDEGLKHIITEMKKNGYNYLSTSVREIKCSAPILSYEVCFYYDNKPLVNEQSTNGLISIIDLKGIETICSYDNEGSLSEIGSVSFKGNGVYYIGDYIHQDDSEDEQSEDHDKDDSGQSNIMIYVGISVLLVVCGIFVVRMIHK